MTLHELNELDQKLQRPGQHPNVTVHYARRGKERSYRGTMAVQGEYLVCIKAYSRFHFSEIQSVDLADKVQAWEYLTDKQADMLIGLETRLESKGKRHKAKRLTNLVYGLIDQLLEAQGRTGETSIAGPLVPDEQKGGQDA